MKCQWVISVTLKQLLLDHQDAIAPEHNDPIHELLDDLGEVPTIESLIGELCGSGIFLGGYRVLQMPAVSHRDRKANGMGTALSQALHLYKKAFFFTNNNLAEGEKGL